ncbi:recombinase family protein [Lachnospiraceae bacterium 38-10]
MSRVAVYLRLSMEDADDRDESNSISSQRVLIMRYIDCQEELRKMERAEFCDDGFSGTDMKRPGIQRMLGEVKAGRIGCIVVKDMSRFSRDYIELGTYMNQIFPFLGVRFIAINDHYDSREHKGNTAPIDTAFQTLLYDLYSKDISVKVKAALDSKCANGEFAFGTAPFGYERSKEIKNRVVVNPDEAEVVRDIFSLAYAGNSSTQIARMLNEKKTPTAMQMRHPDRKNKDEKIRAWSTQAVRHILNNRFYLGEMTYGRTRRKYVGSKAGIKTPETEWKTIENHHEPLVTAEVYEKVCSFHDGVSVERKMGKNPLVGKLYCGGCGYTMAYKPLRGKNKHRRFECYKHATLQIPDCCTYFSADMLEELVLSMLVRELMLRGDAGKQKENLHSFQKACMKRLEKELAENRNQRELLSQEKADLYESYALGEMDAVSYREKADGLAEQRVLLSDREKELLEKIEGINEELRKTDEDMRQIIKFSRMERLTQEAVDAFIRRIYVYKDKRIEIEWNFRE